MKIDVQNECYQVEMCSEFENDRIFGPAMLVPWSILLVGVGVSWASGLAILKEKSLKCYLVFKKSYNSKLFVKPFSWRKLALVASDLKWNDNN